MSHLQLIQEATHRLEQAQVQMPQWIAEQLLAERLGCLPVDLYVRHRPIEDQDRVRFQSDVAARADGMPLQYLLGSADFYGRRFQVGPGVFNPRPETEVLVETVLALLASCSAVADVGTGSGAIAVTLAAERPDLEVIAVEQSSIALHFARRNAAAQGARVRFLQGNLLEPLRPGCVDGIVANLPYLNPDQALAWPRELAWEPWLALDGGREGLELIKTVIRQASGLLEPQRWLALEIGMGQASGVRLLAEQNGFRVERTVQDLSGLDRVMLLRAGSVPPREPRCERQAAGSKERQRWRIQSDTSRRSDAGDGGLPPQPEGLGGFASSLGVARRRRSAVTTPPPRALRDSQLHPARSRGGTEPAQWKN